MPPVTPASIVFLKIVPTMKWHSLVFASFFMFLLACQSDSSSSADVSAADLVGRWEIREATRSGQPTETLNGAFMQFEADGNMASNLVGTNESLQYELNGSILIQRGGRMDLDFTVESITDSVLILSMTMRDTPFKMTLHRASATEAD
jgi:hypothetical protein